MKPFGEQHIIFVLLHGQANFYWHAEYILNPLHAKLHENLSCNFSNLAFANFIAGGSLFNRFLIGNSIGNTLPAIGNRPIFDGLFFGGSSIFARKPRQIIRRPR
mgnify:CR=1 FL=1